MKLLLAILICLLPVAAHAITEGELLAELDSVYVARTTPDPVEARDLLAGKLEEFQVVVYSENGRVLVPETIRYFVFNGQAFYDRLLPTKLRAPRTNAVEIAANQAILNLTAANTILAGRVTTIAADHAEIEARRPDGSLVNYLIIPGQNPKELTTAR